jgi:O-antigen/teichoic acid export membrane protein
MTAPENLRTQRTAANFAAGLLYTSVTVLVAFLATPLLLDWLGTERFGAFRAAGDWFSHLGILELGLSGALAPLLALALGRGDRGAVRSTMAEGIRAFVIVTAAAIAAGAALTLVITWLVPVTPALAADLKRACLIGLVGLLAFPLTPFRQLAEGGQRGYVVSAFLLAQSLVTTGLALLLARAGWGISGQFLALLAGQAVFVGLLVRDGLVRVPGMLGEAMRGPRDADARARLRHLNLPTFLFDLSGRVGLLTDNIVLALMLGPAKVVPLYMTQRLIVLAQGQLQGVGNSSWAGLAELHARGHHERFNARLVELTHLVAALGVAVLVPLAAYNQHFVARWVGSAHFGGDLVTVVAVINAYVLAILSLWGWCFSGTGQVRALVPVSVVGATVNLVASIVLARRVGVAGPLLGTLAGFATTTAWFLPLQLHRTFGTRIGSLAGAAVRPVLLSAPLCALVVWLARAHEPAGWIGLGAEMAAAAGILLAFWWFVVLRAVERSSYKERLRAMMPRRAP